MLNNSNIFDKKGNLNLPETNPELEDMLSLFMEDKRMKERNIAPDVAGVEYFFLCGFITSEMELDFPAIEQDFIRNCSDKLQEYNEMGWYGDDGQKSTSPADYMHHKMLRLMFNGAKKGDAYCVALMKYLFKIYHKREYNLLKRFRTLSFADILSLCTDKDGDADFTCCARFLVMSQFMDITLEESCSVVYRMLDKERINFQQEDEKASALLEFDDELFDECVHQAEIWMEPLNACNRKEKEQRIQNFLEMDKFAGRCMRNQGYPKDYIYTCMENYRGLTLQFARTLAILRSRNKTKEYTFEEVQRYVVLYSTIVALANTADDFCFELGYLTGESVDEFELKDMLFRPENISYTREDKKQEMVPTKNVIASVADSKADEKEYLAEIAELRRKVHEKEQEEKLLREQLQQYKKAQNEAEILIKKYQSERDELIALREFVYKQEQIQEESVSENKLEKMKQLIADKKIVIIGGHVNWINKLKKLFPKWMYIQPDAYKTVDGKMLEGKDRVYFFTDHINHITYYKFIAAVRERNIPFGYIAFQNVDLLVKQIYNECDKYK